MKKYILPFLFLIVANFSFAQSETIIDSYSESVKQCLINNGTRDYYSNVVDEMFTMLQKQYADKNVPESVWTDLKVIKTETLDELSQMVVSAYRGHYTQDDLNKMNQMFTTETGKKMFTNPGSLTEADKFVVNDFYNSEVGQKIIGSQESMNKIMSQISEMWSSDLYQSVVSKLEEKGY